MFGFGKQDAWKLGWTAKVEDRLNNLEAMATVNDSFGVRHDRISSIEEQLKVRKRNKSVNLSSLLTPGTIGETVAMLKDRSYNATVDSERVEVEIRKRIDGDEYDTIETFKLSDVIAALLDHCGLELQEEKTIPVSLKKKDND